MKQALLLLCLTLMLQPEQVKRVIDGDTFILYAFDDPPEERVRLLGVDTPERGQPGAEEATAFTRHWLAQGPSELTSCGRDSFGRRLAGVVRGAESLSGALLQRGLAKVMTR